MKLPYSNLTLTLEPEARLYWPRASRGSITRGAFGTILRRIACDPLCPGVEDCRFAEECAYQLIFSPRAPEDSTRLRLNRDRPRPFVVVTEDDEPEQVLPGEQFRITLRLFGWAAEFHPYVMVVFRELFQVGFGLDRVPVQVVSAELDGAPLTLDERSFQQPEVLDLGTGLFRASRSGTGADRDIVDQNIEEAPRQVLMHWCYTLQAGGLRMPTTKKRLNITLNDDIYGVLEELARKQDQSMSALARKLIEHALELQEDLYFSKSADERLERGEERLSHEKAWD